MAYGVAFCLSIFCLRCRYEFMMLDLAMRRSHDVIFLHWLEEQAKTSQPFSCHCHFSWTPKIIFYSFSWNFLEKSPFWFWAKKCTIVTASIGSVFVCIKLQKLAHSSGKNYSCMQAKSIINFVQLANMNPANFIMHPIMNSHQSMEGTLETNWNDSRG